MVMISEKQLMDLKQNLVSAKYRVVEAEATRTEIVNNLEVQKEELKQLGISSVEEIDSVLEKLQNDISEEYAKYNALYENISAILK